MIAHPVALDADARLRWQRVLEAAGVEAQPFAQLARTVHLVAESDAEDTAWKALEGATLRAVYLDLSLPDLPGAEVLSRLRATAPTLPVVLSSGFDARGINNATLASATVFLQKPFRGGELLDAMRKALGR